MGMDDVVEMPLICINLTSVIGFPILFISGIFGEGLKLFHFIGMRIFTLI